MGGAIDPNAIPLPSGWSVFAKGYLLRAVGLARYALTHVRSWCAHSPIARVRAEGARRAARGRGRAPQRGAPHQRRTPRRHPGAPATALSAAGPIGHLGAQDRPGVVLRGGGSPIPGDGGDPRDVDQASRCAGLDLSRSCGEPLLEGTGLSRVSQWTRQGASTRPRTAQAGERDCRGGWFDSARVQ